MNTFIGMVSLTIATLIHFGVLQVGEEELVIKLSLALLAGIFFLRAEIAEIKKGL